jgi:hypothetical protein
MATIFGRFVVGSSHPSRRARDMRRPADENPLRSSQPPFAQINCTFEPLLHAGGTRAALLIAVASRARMGSDQSQGPRLYSMQCMLQPSLGDVTVPLS